MKIVAYKHKLDRPVEQKDIINKLGYERFLLELSKEGLVNYNGSIATKDFKIQLQQTSGEENCLEWIAIIPN